MRLPPEDLAERTSVLPTTVILVSLDETIRAEIATMAIPGRSSVGATTTAGAAITGGSRSGIIGQSPGSD